VNEKPPTRANRPPTAGISPKWVNRLFFVILWPVGGRGKLGKLILRKIIKIAATRCHILKLKCTKFDFSAPSDPLARFKGPTSKGKVGRGGGGRGRGGRRMGITHALFSAQKLHWHG